jgi:ParB-like chromosome segregation protein Spo0J/uncharacterized protein YqfB (UPF0267 family)
VKKRKNLMTIKFRGKEVKPSPYNPRIQTENDELEVLNASLKTTEGPVQRIVLRDKGSYWETIIGHKRIKALEAQGIKELKEEWVDIRNVSDEVAQELITAEGLARTDLSEIEKGKMCYDLMKKYPEKYSSLRSLAQALGFSDRRIAQWIELYQTSCEAASHLKERIAKFEPKKKEKKTIAPSTFQEIMRSKVLEPEEKEEVIIRAADLNLPRSRVRRILKLIPEHGIEGAFEIVCPIERPKVLPFQSYFIIPILSGQKVQTARGKSYGFKEGDEILAKADYFAKLRITKVEKKRLEEFSEEDAKREGCSSLEEFREIWKQINGDWNPKKEVYVYRFKITE